MRIEDETGGFRMRFGGCKKRATRSAGERVSGEQNRTDGPGWARYVPPASLSGAKGKESRMLTILLVIAVLLLLGSSNLASQPQLGYGPSGDWV